MSARKETCRLVRHTEAPLNTGWFMQCDKCGHIIRWGEIREGRSITTCPGCNRKVER